MEVVSIGDRGAQRRRENLLEVLEDLKARIERGEIDEFVAVSTDIEGEVKLHASIQDSVGGIGLLEIGKHILITQHD
jgi:hypothetical protein